MKIDFLSRTIVVTEKTLKKASNPHTIEFEELYRLMRELPDFAIRVKHNRSVDNRNRGLTYEYMGRYIAAHAPERMDEFNHVRVLSGNPVTSKWFRETFPDHDTTVYLCARLDSAA